MSKGSWVQLVSEPIVAVVVHRAELIVATKNNLYQVRYGDDGITPYLEKMKFTHLDTPMPVEQKGLRPG